MRDMTPMERKSPKEIKLEPSISVKQVLNILDHMIAGKRFGELDSAKQIYLLDCQAKLDDMQQGYFTENSLIFLRGAIDGLMKTLSDAHKDVCDVMDKL